MSNDTAIAVDVAKNVFQLGVSDRPGKVRRTERLQRAQFLPFLATQPASTVVMEACGSAQFWARRIEQLGHRVVLLPAHLVRPYVRGNKTDRTDVKGILEAYRNEDIRPVPVKTPAHQALAALHRLRSAWVAERTARLNTIRGLLRELGVFIPVGARKVIPEVWPRRPVFNDWLPCARIPSWPGAQRAPTREAGDTFAVRPAQHHSRPQPRPPDDNVFPQAERPSAARHQWRPPGGARGQGLRPCTPGDALI